MELTVSIEQFREELQTWKYELSSIKQEIRHFETHLEKLSLRALPKELLVQVEHFQNLFICQKEVIDQLRHDLPDSGNKVASIFDNEALTEGLDERMQTFRKIYRDIKQDFKRFDPDRRL